MITFLTNPFLCCCWFFCSFPIDIQFPIVGMQPFQSMEQLGPLLVFIVLQVFLVVHLLLKVFAPNASKNVHDFAQVAVCVGGFVVCVILGSVLFFFVLLFRRFWYCCDSSKWFRIQC